MRLADVLKDRSIPEWSRCYYDLEGVKIFTKHTNKVIIIQQKLKLYQNIHQEQVLYSQSEERLKPSTNQNLLKQNFLSNLLNSIKQAHQYFFKYHTLNKDIVFLFGQLKLHQLNSRLEKYQNWSTKIRQSKEAYEFILENVYREGKMLYRMIQVNMMAFKNIKIIHFKTFQQNFNLQLPPSNAKRFQRTIEELQTYFLRVQNLYMIINKPLPQRQRSENYQQIAPNPLLQSISSYIFGLMNGISISLIILSIIIYGTSQISSYDPRFEYDFPTWRAIAYVILHMWAFALNTLVFEKYKINYSLIFGGSNMKQRSSFALYLASFFTFEYMILFVIYLLNLTNLIHIQSNITFYFPAIMWGSILVIIIMPFPILHHKGRIQFFKQLLMTLVSPLFPVHFNVIFMTEQLISHILPVSDLVYTICYYTNSPFGNSDINNKICEDYLHSAEYFGIVIFSYRLIQSLKVAYQNKVFKDTREMYICIRAGLNLFIIIISLISSFQRKLAIFWIVIAVPICFFNYYVDLKWDWGLLQPNSKNKYLRDFIVFQKHQYYTIMVINLIFRFISLLAISQNIIYHTLIQPLYLIFTIAIIEIIRRLFWNILKVQREHAINCEKFRVKKYYHQNQELIEKQLNQRDTINQGNSTDALLERTRKYQEIQNLKEFIDVKMQMRYQIQQWKTEQQKILDDIERKIEQNYKQSQQKHLKKSN